MQVEDFIAVNANGDPDGLRRALCENFRALGVLYGCPRDKVKLYRELYKSIHEALRTGHWNLTQVALAELDTHEDEFLAYFNNSCNPGNPQLLEECK